MGHTEEVKLCFIPADLHLDTDRDGQVTVTLQGTVIFQSASRAKALKKFNEVKKELEKRFPAHDLSTEEKSALFRQAIAEALVKHNSLRPETKKSAARGTRTFG